MAATQQAGLARVTVVAPHTRVDLALPHAATIAELLSSLLRVTGEEAAGPYDADGGWVLSRFAAPPLDAGRTVESLAIRDGEVLYLSPRERAQPSPVFDDIVDAVATTAGDPQRRWTPATTRTAGLLAGLLGLLAATAAAGSALDAAGVSRTTAVAVLAATGGSALALVAVAGVLSRAFGDAVAGAVAAAGAVALATVAGVAAVVVSGSSATGREALAAAGGTGLVAVLLGLLAVGDFLPVFVGAGSSALVAALAGLGASATGCQPQNLAAVTGALALGLQAALPVLSLRLARMPLPRLPADLTGQARDDEALAGVDTLRRGRAAADVLTALLAADALVVAASGVVLAVAGGTAARWLAGILALALVMRARTHPARGERGVLLLAGLTVAGVLVAVLTADAGAPGRAAAAFPALAIAGLVVLLATVAGVGREPSPYWWRLLDLVEIAALVAVVPVALAVPGAYGYMHGLGG
ncbi:type VII secretion integral membrane protein EccD [Motilibacter peucedani]|uniref:Type VII secretion integral membrane protein EccD n=1 Tax=Motilibacter peucedani TaxID=598650 RepID=A0A420XN03_9ACTN|nr:type VII secretion integral membrane protein EccD [Motilibacter peucedani]RKS72664.1 type VII secretion integral membrane protein EccD [Motilibacter peucedani]